MPLDNTWKNRTFSSPEVISAYTSYCRRLIKRFSPAYFAYGIEVNAEFTDGDAAFSAYMIFADKVYTALKKEHPQLPIFHTFQTASFNKTHGELLALTQKMLAHSDMIALSTFPFWFYDKPTQDANPTQIPSTWLADFRALDPGKPFAIAETGYVAENFELTSLGVKIQGTETWQRQYVALLFQEALLLDARFIAWFVLRDYDQLWKGWQAQDPPPEWMKTWKDTGLMDGEGTPRSGLAIWDQWLARPRS